MKNTNNRITILDSFRFFAILSVMLFHYYSLWFIPKHDINMYPYGKTYDYFSYGYLGVDFFFMLSGFVIAYSLAGSINFIIFWKKKLIRLLPPILLCSLTTLIVFRLLDTGNLLENSHSFKNVLTSIALISPNIINHIFGTHRDYINGSYWFLWPEVQFYFIASVLYFFSKKHFVRNYAFLSIFIHASYYVINRIIANTFSTNRLHLHLSTNSISQYQFWTNSFNFIEYNLLFLIGIMLFQLYNQRTNTWTITFLALTAALEFIHLGPIENWIVMGIVAMFLLFIFAPQFLDWLNLKPLIAVGVSSYSLYLIHEFIGVLLIHKYANYFGKFNFIFPILLIVSFMILCYLSYNYVEQPIGKFLKQRLIRTH